MAEVPGTGLSRPHTCLRWRDAVLQHPSVTCRQVPSALPRALPGVLVGDALCLSNIFLPITQGRHTKYEGSGAGSSQRSLGQAVFLAAQASQGPCPQSHPTKGTCAPAIAAHCHHSLWDAMPGVHLPPAQFLTAGLQLLHPSLRPLFSAEFECPPWRQGPLSQ